MSRILIAEAVELSREALRAASYTTSCRDGLVAASAALERRRRRLSVKPFAFDELDARAGARVRAQPTVLSTADLRLDPRCRTAFLADREVRLTAREFTLVETLLRHRARR